jgi:hypothetical protein
LERWNTGRALLAYCPACGAKLPKKQRGKLWWKCSDGEIEDRIKGALLDLLDWCDEVSADELTDKAWESENRDGVVFYSNYEADQFCMRHYKWVDIAFDHAAGVFGEDFVRAGKQAGNDAFLVVAFTLATEHFLYDQCGVDGDEGNLSKKRIREIEALIKHTSYDGRF